MSDAPILLKSLRSHFLGGREVAASGLPVLRKQVVGNGVRCPGPQTKLTTEKRSSGSACSRYWR